MLEVFYPGEGNETGGEGKVTLKLSLHKAMSFVKGHTINSGSQDDRLLLGQHSSLSLCYFDTCVLRISFKSKESTLRNHFSNSIDRAVSG